MSFEYVGLEEAMNRTGLRMVVVGGIPSAWGESAKGILHVKKIDWTAVRVVYDDKRLKTWAGQRSGPVAIYEDERPRDGWAGILLLAERLAPTPSLLPAAADERALAFGLSHELCGEDGLGWARRLQLIHARLTGNAGFAKPVAAYLGKKYGYTSETGAAATARVGELLRMLTSRLDKQREMGSRYYIGESVSAVDIYSACFMAMFAPLPEDVCKMNEATREAFEMLDDATAAALSSQLLEHRDMMYETHLELPLSL